MLQIPSILQTQNAVCQQTSSNKHSHSRYKVLTHGLAFHLGLEFGHSVRTSYFHACKSVALLLQATVLLIDF